MNRIVVDSSVVLAVLLGEPGASLVEQSLGGAMISTVNLAEVATKQLASGVDLETARQEFDELGIEVVDFTRGLAEDAAALAASIKALGLSLGDRACIALARRENLPALTADRAWRDVDVGVRIELIR